MAVFEELSSASEFEEQIANIQGQIDNLDDTYATDSDIQGLQGQIDTLEETVAGLGTGGGGASVKTETVALGDLYNFLVNNYDKVLNVKMTPTTNITFTPSQYYIKPDGAITYTSGGKQLITIGKSFYFTVNKYIEGTNTFFFLTCKLYNAQELVLRIGSSNHIMEYTSRYASSSEAHLEFYTMNWTNGNFTVTYIE